MVFCDNLASVTVLNSGRSKDPFLLSCLRELCYISAAGEFQVRARHLEGKDNRIADLLSRWDQIVDPLNKLRELSPGVELVSTVITDSLFSFTHDW